MARAARALALLALVAAPLPAGAQATTPADAVARQQAYQRYREGQQLLLHDAYGEAQEEFRAALALDRTLALAHYGLGQAHMGRREYDEAARAFLACRAAYAQQAMSAARTQEHVNRWLDDETRALEDTRQQLEAQLRQGAQNPQLQRALTRVVARIDQIGRLRQRGDGPFAEPAGVALALGSAYLRGGHLAEAEREYRLALQGNPRMGEAHNNLAYVYMVTGRLPEAEKALKLAEKNGFHVDPDFKAELKRKQR